MSRRMFTGLAATAAASLALAGPSALMGCRSARGDEIFKGERTIVDDWGRELVIPTPERLESVYFTSSLAQVFVSTLAPDLMGARCTKFSEEDLRYLPEGIGDLRYLGSLSTNEMDVEAVMVTGVQLIFSISAVGLTEANLSEAEDIENRSGIPVVLVDGSFERIDKAYALIGSILGREERAAELSAYCEAAYAAVTSAVADIPEEEKVAVYYAEGPLGLQTEPDVSQHALVFSVAGARNVAEVEHVEAAGMSNVSLESVMAWDPEVIIAWDAERRGGADHRIRTHEDWSVVGAVRTGRVYTMPNVPYSWVDRPPACNRFLGIQWIANMLYPDRYDVDMVEVTKEFYQLFYGVEITDDEAKGFLGTSYPPYRA